MKKAPSNPTVDRFSAQRGSMLLELALVTLLLGMFAVGAILQLNPPSVSAHAAMLKVAYDLRYAQNLAMVTGVKHGLRTIDSTRYEIYRQSPGQPVKDPSSGEAMSLDLADDFGGARFGGAYRVEFDAMGRPVLGGGSVVAVRGAEIEKSFKVINNTGMLDIP